MNKYTKRRIGALVILLILAFVGIRYFVQGKNTNTVKDSKTSSKTSTKAILTLEKKTTTKAISSNKTEKKTSKASSNDNNSTFKEVEVEEDGVYSSKIEVASYISKYKKLPKNYLKKKEAESLGWQASKGNLWEVTDKMSIGGDNFLNAEGLLEKKSGRKYYEVDIDYRGGQRNAKRIIYSNDGLIFYTDDHYMSFERLK